MGISVFIHLDRVRCAAESDQGRSEPYAWTALIAGDQSSFETGEIVVSAPDAARTVIGSMRAGDQVPMPSAQRRLEHQFGDELTFGFVGIVVVMLDENDLPGDSVRAGYRRFLKELKAELGKIITQMRVPDAREQAHVMSEIRSKVKAAIVGKLSFWEKVLFGLGFREADDQLGSNSTLIPVTGTAAVSPFTLTFEKKIKTRDVVASPSNAPPILGPEIERVLHHYEIDGSFELLRDVRDHRTSPRQPPTTPPQPRPRPPGTHEP